MSARNTIGPRHLDPATPCVSNTKEVITVKQIHATKSTRPTAPLPIDTRTPSGRVLPF